MRAASGDQLLALLGRCRRRLAWLQFVRWASYAVTAALAGVAGLMLIYRPDAGSALSWVGAALVAGAAVAAACAVLQTPDLAATAAALDRALSLEDRTSAAFQFVANGDPVAQWIVRDAGERLAGVEPSRVFAVRRGARARTLVVPATATVLTVALLTAFLPPTKNGQSDADMTSRAAHAGNARALSTRHGEVPPDAGPGAGPLAAPNAGPSAAIALASTESAATPAQDRPATAGDRSALDPVSSSDAERPSEGQSAIPNRSPRGGPDDGFAGGNDDSANGNGPGHGGNGKRDVATRSGAGAGVSADGPIGRGAGGLRATSGSPSPAPASAARDGRGASYPARYRAAWAEVEAALTGNQIPTSRRTYVRDYFVAIRPAERR